MKKIAVYDPYLNTLGGGEKHILSIAQIFQKHNYKLHIFWDKNLQNSIQNTLHIPFTENPVFLPNIFNKNQSALSKMNTLSQFDVFLYTTDGSYFLSNAKYNYIFAMVPDRKLYKMNLINKFKTHNYKFISNSSFTKKNLNEWGIKSDVIYPYVDDTFLEIKNTEKKEKIILSVGRFFKHLHSKRQDLIIDYFKNVKTQNKNLNTFKLILAGGLKDEDTDYFESLNQRIGKDKSIILKPNISYAELLGLYKKAMIYWHFAGIGVNENEEPEKVEHLGLTPLEAMASGCLTICFKAGGPKELIQERLNGFLFTDEKSLNQIMNDVLKNDDLISQIKNNAKNFVKNNFSYDVFTKTVVSTMNI